MATYAVAEMRTRDTQALIDESIRLFQEAGDAWGEAYAKRWLGSKVELRGDATVNIAHQREAVDEFFQLGDRWSAGWLAFDLGYSLLAVERYEEARRAFEEAMELVDHIDDRLVVAHATRGLGSVTAGLERPEEAEKLFLDSIPMFERIGDDSCLSFTRMYLADVLSRKGRKVQVIDLLTRAVEGFARVDDEAGIAAALGRLARTTLESGDSLMASRLLGAAESVLEGAPYALARREVAEYEMTSSAVAEAIEPSEMRRLKAEGARLTKSELLMEVLALRERSATSPEKGRPTETTSVLMFTDMVESTSIVDLIGDEAWADLIAWHDRTLRALIDEHEGNEIDHAGDGFFVSFESASDAAKCAIDIQRSLHDHRKKAGFAPRVRICVHMGSMLKSRGRLVGHQVHMAARIGSAAAGDEILVTRPIIAELDRGYQFEHAREISVKGIDGPLEVAALVWSS